MRATGVRFEALADDREIERFLYRLDWIPAAAGPGAIPDGAWIVLGEAGELAEKIRAHGKTVFTRTDFSSAGRIAGIVHMGTAGNGSLTLAPLIQALDREAGQHPPRLYLVTRGTQAAGAAGVNNVAGADLWGAGAVLANEHPALRCKRIDLSPSPYDGECDALWRELLSADEERAVALRPEGRFVARLSPWGRPSACGGLSGRLADHENYRVAIARRGVLDELALERTARDGPGPGEIEIEVVAAGLNFVDVMKAMDLDPTQAGAGPVNLGGECAGVVRAAGDGVETWRAGDEVIAFTPSFERTGCFARFVRVPADCAVRKPASLGFEEAATLPLAFITAWQALYRTARLQRGERVLIHSAAGGVGLAAVQLARLAGAEVYATAGTEEKRELLRSLGAAGVFDSHSLSFASEILKATGGEGVDVVLNSLAGDAVERSLSILRRYGRFVEIGKRTLRQNSFIELQPFAKSLSFCAVDIASMVEDRRAEILRMLSDLVGKVETGILQPLPYTVYPAVRGRAGISLHGTGQAHRKNRAVFPRRARGGSRRILQHSNRAGWDLRHNRGDRGPGHGDRPGTGAPRRETHRTAEPHRRAGGTGPAGEDRSRGCLRLRSTRWRTLPKSARPARPSAASSMPRACSPMASCSKAPRRGSNRRLTRRSKEPGTCTS